MFKNKSLAVQQADANKSRRFTLGQYIVAVSALLLSVTAISYAAGLLTLIQFSPSTVISSTDVNTNFQRINDQLATMTAAVSDVQAAAALDATTKANSAQAGAQATQIGVGQSWQDLTGTKISGTPYTNNTGRPIQVSIVLNSTGSVQGSIAVGGVTLVNGMVGAAGATHQYTFIVPNSAIYLLNLTAGTVNKWIELR